MASRPLGKRLVIFRDVENISEPIEFVQRVYQDVESYLSKRQKTASKTQALLQQLGGAKVLGFTFPEAAAPQYKALLESILGDLAQNTESEVVLLWDELPWMLQKIIKNHGNDVVIDLLDTLRSIRQTYPNIRMIYTGSIGLHHVTSALKDEGYNNSPINDMRVLDVPTLASDDAQVLAQALLKGEQLSSALTPDNQQTAAKCIAEQTDNVPYYIHHVVSQLSQQSIAVDEDAVKQTISDAMADSHDPWQLEHYRKRLKSYYGEDAPIAQAILDILATSDGQNLMQIQQQLQLIPKLRGKSAKVIHEGDIASVRDLVKALQRDHYLVQDPKTAALQFKFQLIRRWWRFELGLI